MFEATCSGTSNQHARRTNVSLMTSLPLISISVLVANEGFVFLALPLTEMPLFCRMAPGRTEFQAWPYTFSTAAGGRQAYQMQATPPMAASALPYVTSDKSSNECAVFSMQGCYLTHHLHSGTQYRVSSFHLRLSLPCFDMTLLC